MLSKNKTLLIVDDSIIILDRLAFMLKKFNNKGQVFSVKSSAEALHVLQTVKVHIALFDIHLQGQSGIDLLRAVSCLYPDIIVIMLTNNSDEQVEKACLAIGAKYFLDKSKDFNQIPRIIAASSIDIASSSIDVVE